MVRRVVLGGAVGVACGVASAVFLHVLGLATAFRGSHEILVYALPIAGVIIGLVYERYGASIKGGNNLVLDTIHDASPPIPLRMAPMVLVGTVLTHLFGGSAGREGTAIQMGASLADAIATRVKATADLRRELLVAGIAGGFGSVFGTPIAGAVFGIEVLTIGRARYDALVPALVASLVGDVVTRRLGVVHTLYPEIAHVDVTLIMLGKLSVIGVAMGLATIAFIELTHRLKHFLEAKIPRLPMRMFGGGLVVVALWKLLGTSDYLGLGVPMILRSFTDPTVASSAFAAKIVFTSITLGAGFLGGEVTPLFFIGATLGCALANALGIPIELGAAVGVGAVFGAGANTPFALSIMVVELVGVNAFPHVVLVSVIAYLVAGHRGIYPSQRLHRRKYGGVLVKPIALRDYRH